MYWKSKKPTCAVLSMLLLSLLFSHRAYSQGRFALSVDAAPGLERNTSHYDSAQTFSDRLSVFRLGSSLHFQISEQWSLSSGLWLEWMQRNREVEAFGKVSVHRFKVPLLIHYQLSTNQLSPYVSAGVVLEKFRYSVISMADSPNNLTLFNIGTKPQLKYLVGAGVRYKFSEQLSGTLLPMFTYGSRGDGYEKSSEFSLQTQLLFHF